MYMGYSHEKASHCQAFHRFYRKMNCLQQCNHATLLDITISFEHQNIETSEECLSCFSRQVTETVFFCNCPTNQFGKEQP